MKNIPVGGRVRVKSRTFLDQFQRQSKYRHPISSEQLAVAGTTDTVKGAGIHRDGYALLELTSTPGMWHEECLEWVEEDGHWRKIPIALVDFDASLPVPRLCSNPVMPPIPSHRVKSDDAEIVYWVLGDGPFVLLLHPFPANHEFWLPVAETLSTRYRVILPDLRGHGESTIGEGPATMQKHAADLARVMDNADIGRAPLIGVSIGGYLLFEFWRKHRSRVAALGLCNTKAPADNAEARAGRLQAANDVLERGTEPFLQSMVQRVFAKTTRETRPDLVEGALRMMRQMSPEDIAQVQRGMADRPDSVDTLKTIDVPTLLVTGDEDILTGLNEAQLMRQHIKGSDLRVIPKAGHYSPWEQPEDSRKILREFLDRVRINA